MLNFIIKKSDEFTWEQMYFFMIQEQDNKI